MARRVRKRSSSPIESRWFDPVAVLLAALTAGFPVTFLLLREAEWDLAKIAFAFSPFVLSLLTGCLIVLLSRRLWR